MVSLLTDKTVLRCCDLCLGCFAASGQQLFDGRRGDFLVDGAAFLPRRQIGNTCCLEQRLRFVREAKEPLFPHEDVNAFRLFAEQVVDGGEDFAVTGFAVSCVQMAQALNLNVSTLIPLNGKARTAQRQISRQNPQ